MKKIKIVILLLVTILIIIRSDYVIATNGNHQDVFIHISLNKTKFLEGESVRVTINITNHGNEIIYSEDYCFTFMLIYPKGSEKELFLTSNASYGKIFPNENYERTFPLLAYTDDKNIWQGIGYLPVGHYKICAVYNSKTNLPYSKGNPYNETISNILNFEIISKDKSSEDENEKFILIFNIIPILIVIVIFIILIFLKYLKRI